MTSEEIAELKRLNHTLWEACAKAAELIQHDEDGTGKWLAVDVLEKAVDACIEYDQRPKEVLIHIRDDNYWQSPPTEKQGDFLDLPIGDIFEDMRKKDE